MTQEFNPTEWITTKDAAEMTGYHPVHIRRLIRGGQVKGMKFGRDWMVERVSLKAYADKMDQLGAAKHDPWHSGGRAALDKD